MLEECRQLVGERRVFSHEVLNVAARFSRRTDSVVEQAVEFVDDQCVKVVLVTDRHRWKDDWSLDHFHVYLTSSASSSSSFIWRKKFGRLTLTLKGLTLTLMLGIRSKKNSIWQEFAFNEHSFWRGRGYAIPVCLLLSGNTFLSIIGHGQYADE